jgi:hypothetical protein
MERTLPLSKPLTGLTKHIVVGADILDWAVINKVTMTVEQRLENRRHVNVFIANSFTLNKFSIEHYRRI